MLKVAIRKLRELRRDAFYRKRRKAILRSGFWFVDIPRTGSTSLKVQLESLSFKGYGKSGHYSQSASSKPFFRDHTSACQVRDSIGEENWSNLYTFSIIRNPWSRFFSLYNYRIKAGLLSPSVSFEEYVHLLKQTNVWSESSPFRATEYWWPMTGYLASNASELLVENIFRFEEYGLAIKEIRNKLGVALASSTSLNESGNDLRYRDAYTTETREIIEQYYASDIERFAYTF